MEREREKNNTKPQIVFSDPTGPSSETPIPLFLSCKYCFVIEREHEANCRSFLIKTSEGV